MTLELRSPPSPEDDAAWDAEAMKLFFVEYGKEWFNNYVEAAANSVRGRITGQLGVTGLVLLGFCATEEPWDGCVSASQLPEDMKPHGQALMLACKRMRDSLR